MPNLLLVMIGGALGAGLRYQAGRVAAIALGPGFPWGTLAVNLLGGLLIGLLAGSMPLPQAAERPSWLFLAVGVLGGFTTFSAFGLDVFEMAGRGEIGPAAAYVLASVAGSLLLLAAGYAAAKALS